MVIEGSRGFTAEKKSFVKLHGFLHKKGCVCIKANVSKDNEANVNLL